MGSSFSNICSLKSVKGNQSIVRVITADHDCVWVRFAASISCHHWHLPWFVMGRLFLKWNPEKLQRVFAQRWTDGDCCSCSVIVRRYYNFANRLWGKSDISTLPNSKRNANVWMLKQIEDIKELWILSTVFFNKWERITAEWRSQMQACFGRQRGTFSMQNSKTCYIVKILR